MSKILKGTLIAGAVIFGGVFLAGAGFAFAGTATFWTIANTIAINAFLGGISAQLQSKNKTSNPVETVEYAGTVEPRRIIYGKRLVSGMHALDPLTSGTNNKYLHQLLVLAGHKCNAVDAVYFNGEAVGTIGSISGTSSDGAVSSGTYSGKAWIRTYLGTASQTVDYILTTAFPTEWDSNHRLRGLCYSATQLEYAPDTYKNGKPTVTYLMEGKLCYDPRLDSSPGNDPTNASYIAYTTNPALCLADFLIDDLGLGEDAVRIDWDMVVTAADICEESVTIPTSSTQDRYTCNAVLYATDSFQDSINALAGCMLGTCVYSGGLWRMRAGAWETTSFEITDSNVMGPLELQTAYPYKDRWNGVRGTFIDPDNTYQQNEFPATQDPDYVTDDGESVFKEISLPGCTNAYEAQRSAILIGRKSRNKEVATIPCDMSLWKVRPGDTGIATITDLGWSSQQVRCESWGFTADGQVALTVRAENSADWDDPLESDYQAPLSVSTPTPVYFTPSAPSGLASVGGKNAVNLSWTAPSLMPVGAEYEIYEYTSSTPYSGASKIWKGRATNCSIPHSDTTTRYYWVRVVMPDGTAGSEYPTSSAGVAGAAVAVALSSDGPNSGTYGTGAVSSAPGFTDSSAKATASWTNNTGKTITVQIIYSITAIKGGSDSSIFYRIAGSYNDGSEHMETWVNVYEGSAANDYVTKAGVFTVDVSDGDSISGKAWVGESVPTGTSPSPPGLNYVDAKVSLIAQI